MSERPNKAGLIRDIAHRAGLRTVGNKITDLVGTAYRALYVDSTGNVVEQAFGSSGQVWTSGGASSAPSWAAAAGGGMLNVMVTPLSRHSIGMELAATAVAAPGANTWPAANLAIYVPFVLDAAATVVKMFWLNGAAVSGNVDVGIYNEAFARQVAIGSTAQATINVIQEVNIADTALAAGRYYLALALDNATGEIGRVQAVGTNPIQQIKCFGMAQQASAFALPATMTPAVVTNNYIPIFGASLRTLVA